MRQTEQGGVTVGLISVKKAAEIMDVSRRQVQRLAKDNKEAMGAIWVDNGDDGVWVFDEDKLRAYAATRTKWQRAPKE